MGITGTVEMAVSARSLRELGCVSRQEVAVTEARKAGLVSCMAVTRTGTGESLSYSCTLSRLWADLARHEQLGKLQRC